MKVNLTYFKSTTGKYYAAGDFVVADGLALFEIWDEVERLAKCRQLPGLINGSHGWIISVDVPEHQHRHPKLLLPDLLSAAPDLLIACKSTLDVLSGMGEAPTQSEVNARVRDARHAIAQAEGGVS